MRNMVSRLGSPLDFTGGTLRSYPSASRRTLFQIGGGKRVGYLACLHQVPKKIGF